MAEPYMYDFGPKWSFGFGLTKVTINTHNGLVYPTPSGKVSKDMEDACNALHGQKKTFYEVVNLLRTQIIKDNA